MTFALYENIVVNQAYAGCEAGRPTEQVESQRVICFIRDVPEGTTLEKVAQRLFSGGIRIGENVAIASEAEWPGEVRRVNSHNTDPSIRRSWSDLQ